MLGPFAAQTADRLCELRLIHHEHVQCYTWPRLGRWRWLKLLTLAACCEQRRENQKSTKTGRQVDKETRKLNDKTFSVSPGLLVSSS